MKRRVMNPNDLYALKWVAEARVSPDGLMVAYSVITVDKHSNGYKSQIFVWKDGASRPFTSGEHRESRPRWAKDGKHLAFVSHREEKGSQLYVIPTSGGEAIRIAEFPEEIEEMAWSPKGKHLAFLVRVQDERYEKKEPKDQPPRQIDRLIYRLDGVGWTAARHRELFVVSADGTRKYKQITSGRFENNGLTWSPDGKRLAFVSARHETWDFDRFTDIFVVSSNGGDPERITKTDSSYFSPSWSPDGSMIAASWLSSPMDTPRHQQVAIIDLDSQERSILTDSLDRQCSGARGPIWSDGDIYFTVEDSGNTHLYRVASDGSDKPQMIIGGDQQTTTFDIAGQTLAYVSTKPKELPDLFLLRNSSSQRITNLAEKFSRRFQLSEPIRFSATSNDGSDVEAWCMKPADFEEGKKYPLLLNIHGGPFSQYGNGFFDEFQIFAGAGYALLYSNPRGSSGYSEAWGRAIRGPKAPDPGSGWGVVDYHCFPATRFRV